MEPGRRVHRVEREIQHLLATFLIQQGRGLLPTVVSVAQVEVSADLRHAKVFLSFYGDEDQRDDVVDRVEELRPEAQHVLARNLTMKFTPRLRFLVSRGLNVATH